MKMVVCSLEASAVRRARKRFSSQRLAARSPPVSRRGEEPATGWPRESRLGTPPSPAQSCPKSVGFPPVSLPGQGAGAPPRPPYLGALGQREPGSPGPRAGRWQRRSSRRGWGAGGEAGADRARAWLPWATDPMVRSGWQCPGRSAAGLCIWSGRAGVCEGRRARGAARAARVPAPAPAPAPGAASRAPRSAYSRGNATSFPALRVYRLSMQ